MQIIADRNIPQVEAAFSRLGRVELVDGRALQAEQVAQADLLLVRSVTQVNAALLDGSRVRFVASATIGTDHVDLEYLQARNIHFANAPGCNATSAAEYVIAGLLQYCATRGETLKDKTVAVVGYGNVGSRVAHKLQAFACDIIAYDPPRQAQYADRDYVDWDAVCAADIITAHVPLTRSGSYPTHNMFSTEFFTRLKPGTLFINTARGRAVDEKGLRRVLLNKPLHLLLDVWRNEPNIDLAMLTQTRIATPHIAGYSIEGKLRGTEMIYQAACAFLNETPRWRMRDVLGDPIVLSLADFPGTDMEVVQQLVRRAYPIMDDDARLRKLRDKPESERGAYFDTLRKTYPVRHEFAHYHVQARSASATLRRMLQQLGFTLVNN